MKITMLLILLAPLTGLPNDSQNLNTILHENSGCPIFSSCSKESGKQLEKWEKYINKLPKINFEKSLNHYRKKNGLPVKFLTNKKSIQAIDPIIWNSRCKIHNPKNPNNKTYKAISFFKNAPKSELITLNKVVLFGSKNKTTTFRIPYEDIPLMIKNNEIVIIKNYDELYYNLSVNSNRKWKVIKLASEQRRLALSKRVKNSTCPENKESIPTGFTKTYCQEIWDIDKKKLRKVQLFWSCP